MTYSVFDVALEKRFTDSTRITSIDVTSGDALLIRNAETGVVMLLSFYTLTTAILSAFSTSFASLVGPWYGSNVWLSPDGITFKAA